MKKTIRMAGEIIAPPMIAAAGFLVWEGISNRTLPEWSVVVGFLIWAYFFAAMPSFVYAMMMEKAFDRGLDPHSWATVRKSTWLGTVAGAAIGLILAACTGNFSFTTTGKIFGIFGPLFAGTGLLVGLILGLLIMAFSPKVERRPGHRLLRWDRPFDGQI